MVYMPIFPYEDTMREITNFLPRGHSMYVNTHSEIEGDMCVITEERNTFFLPVRL